MLSKASELASLDRRSISSTKVMSSTPPQLDFHDYTDGDSHKRARFLDQLKQGLQRWGFFSLVNYGMPPGDIDRLFDLSHQFFALSHAEKMSAPHPAAPNPHRGYSFVGQEFTSGLSRQREVEARQGRRLVDLKETFDWGSTNDKLYPSVWPDESQVPGFRATLEDHYVQARALHMSILRALAECLECDTATFLAAHQDGATHGSEARLAHYPAVEVESLSTERGTSRICEHTDSGSVTLLWQDKVGGLEIEDVASGNFIPVSSPVPAVLVNLGDAMERWTNGVLPAAYHRVGRPSRLAGSSQIPGRFSIMYFGKPDRAASLAPLPQFVSASRPAAYPPVTGEQLNQGTLLRTYESADERRDSKAVL